MLVALDKTWTPYISHARQPRQVIFYSPRYPSLSYHSHLPSMQVFIPPRLYSSDSLYNFPFPIQVLITCLHCPQKPLSYFSLSICTVTPQVNHVLLHLIHEVRHNIARRNHEITFAQQSATVDKHEQSVDLIRQRIPRQVEEEPFVECPLDQLCRSFNSDRSDQFHPAASDRTWYIGQ